MLFGKKRPLAMRGQPAVRSTVSRYARRALAVFLPFAAAALVFFRAPVAGLRAPFFALGFEAARLEPIFPTFFSREEEKSFR